MESINLMRPVLPHKAIVKEKSVFVADIPKDIQLTLKQLRKYNKRG